MLAGDIDFRHAFLDMSAISVESSNYTQAGKTCRAAMGFSFAAGTTDGAHMHGPCFSLDLCHAIYAPWTSTAKMKMVLVPAKEIHTV
jgi:hypothetical protein